MKQAFCLYGVSPESVSFSQWSSRKKTVLFDLFILVGLLFVSSCHFYFYSLFYSMNESMISISYFLRPLTSTATQPSASKEEEAKNEIKVKNEMEGAIYKHQSWVSTSGKRKKEAHLIFVGNLSEFLRFRCMTTSVLLFCFLTYEGALFVLYRPFLLLRGDNFSWWWFIFLHSYNMSRIISCKNEPDFL